MDFFLNITRDISSEIIMIYALIIFIAGLIVLILFLDKKEKHKISMTKTQELRLMDLRKAEDNYFQEFQRQPSAMQTELRRVDRLMDKVKKTEEIDSSVETLDINEDMYVEDDLEKTSAQLQLEMLAKELEKAKELEANKIARFEEEQEENAIISYQELVQAVNEKRARLENSELPKKLEPEIPAELIENVEKPTPETPKFKNSEFISPIFGKDSNNDNFLKELKDFRNNL